MIVPVESCPISQGQAEFAECRIVNQPTAIHAVLIRIPGAAPPRTPEAVQSQRACARIALRHSTELSGAPLDGWTQRDDGAPLPNDGWYWSIAHKHRWATAVVSDRTVGIDIEEIRARRQDLFSEVASETEWRRAGGRTWPAFFRVWTAKEAVLKANGVGIGRLLQCVLSGVDEMDRMTLDYGGTAWPVQHHEFDDHIACVTCGDAPIEWCVIDSSDAIANPYP